MDLNDISPKSLKALADLFEAMEKCGIHSFEDAHGRTWVRIEYEGLWSYGLC